MQIDIPTPTPRPTIDATPMLILEPTVAQGIMMTTVQGAVQGWRDVDNNTDIIDIGMMTLIVLLVMVAVGHVFSQLSDL